MKVGRGMLLGAVWVPAIVLVFFGGLGLMVKLMGLQQGRIGSTPVELWELVERSWWWLVPVLAIAGACLGVLDADGRPGWQSAALGFVGGMLLFAPMVGLKAFIDFEGDKSSFNLLSAATGMQARTWAVPGGLLMASMGWLPRLLVGGVALLVWWVFILSVAFVGLGMGSEWLANQLLARGWVSSGTAKAIEVVGFLIVPTLVAAAVAVGTVVWVGAAMSGWWRRRRHKGLVASEATSTGPLARWRQRLSG